MNSGIGGTRSPRQQDDVPPRSAPHGIRSRNRLPAQRRKTAADTLRIQPAPLCNPSIGGEKTGDDRWYEKFVPIADRLFERHLLEIEREENI
jgi:hypothetical protein